MNVAVLGASNEHNRYSYKAVKTLKEQGYFPLPVHPFIKEIDGLRVYECLEDISELVNTITVYLSANNSDRVAESLIASGASRIIFNPGAENPKLSVRLRVKGIDVVQACTLVLLSTGQF